MANVSGEILINRPVEQVFDFVADQRNEPIYNPRMLQSEKITEGDGVVLDSATAMWAGRRNSSGQYQRARRFGQTTMWLSTSMAD